MIRLAFKERWPVLLHIRETPNLIISEINEAFYRAPMEQKVGQSNYGIIRFLECMWCILCTCIYFCDL